MNTGGTRWSAISIVVGSALATLIFDYIYFKIEHERKVERSWKALNGQLEREGKERCG